ncbi:MAG TPA: homoserine O-acetyltransferase [Xanthomonadaceae bacterium]|nr:homoserine O-acetyltransferase [Xanthomonadaceae bacterium]
MTAALRFHTLPSPFSMRRGGMLWEGRVAYETWGQLNAARDNAVLILTGLSPGAHAASSSEDDTPGWWEPMLGPGKPIDTERFFVVCVNSLGSCMGSTGPASLNPATGRAYRLAFPDLCLEDVAEAAFQVLSGLGIARLACLIGPSMGGMSAQAFMALHPGVARAAVLISTAPHALPFATAVRSLQREAIVSDPDFRSGLYSDDKPPVYGLRFARKLGVITYRSPQEWTERFDRERIPEERREDRPFAAEFQIESYLEGHAQRFVGSFDPCCYIYLSRASDWFDVAEHGDGDLDRAYARMQLGRALVIGVETDILFTLAQQRRIAEGLERCGSRVEFHALPSIQGHDAFLVDYERFAPPVARFLAAL